MTGPVARTLRTRPASSDTPRMRSARAREAHPLLHPFPLAVMTLASFLVAFTLVMAGLRAGVHPQLSARTGTPHLLGSLHGAATARHAPEATGGPAAAAESSGTTVMSRTHAGAGSVTTQAGDD